MKVGSLCSGYGGLELGLSDLFDVDLAWVSDIDKGANKILAHRYPDVPNLGDFTTLDWRDVEPVDVLTAGFPCQDVSHAGKRAGLKPGTRTGIWSHIAEAIAVLRPALCVFENVRGLLSAEAHSNVEPCPWCVGDESDGSLRALGAVLGDLAERGYDCRVTGVRAADVGAPHNRFRVFVIATDAFGERHEWTGSTRHGWAGPENGSLLPTPIASDAGHAGPNQRNSSGRLGLTGTVLDLLPTPRATRGGSATETVELLPTPRASDPAGEMSRSSDGFRPQLGEVARLLPTPAVNDMGEGKTVDAWDEWTDAMQAKHGNGNGHGKSLAIEAQRLLPTPRARDKGTDSDVSTDDHAPTLHQAVTGSAFVESDRPGKRALPAWGDYAPAIARWETVLGRPAPAPTEAGPKGTPRLSPAFVEFLMGLPEGWVTDVPGLTRNEQLKALGNGVVPQQAAAAVGWLLDVETCERVSA